MFRGRPPVTPLAGVWIEIKFTPIPSTLMRRSLPSRECGLKYLLRAVLSDLSPVTPLAGVWIEIGWSIAHQRSRASLPSRECGLKSEEDDAVFCAAMVTPLAGVWIEIDPHSPPILKPNVTPLAGVWIEIGLGSRIVEAVTCHSPRGSVD